MRRFALPVIAIALLCSAFNTARAAVTQVAAFDASKQEFPENLALDGRTGDIYVSMLLIGQVVKVTADGQQIHYQMPPGTSVTGGLVYNDFTRKLYVALTGMDPANTGVWQLDADGNIALYSHVAGGTLNGMTANYKGEIFTADSITGFVWKSPAGGGEASVWVDLHAPGAMVPPGPNGIKFSPRGDLYVSITNQFRIVKIPVLEGGLPGIPTTVVQASDFVPDDFAFDIEGDLYVANNNYLTDAVPTSQIERVHPDGTREVLAGPADGLFFSTAVQFGRTPFVNFRDLYMTNGALSPNPGILKLSVPDDIGFPVADWVDHPTR